MKNIQKQKMIKLKQKSINVTKILQNNYKNIWQYDDYRTAYSYCMMFKTIKNALTIFWKFDKLITIKYCVEEEKV